MRQGKRARGHPGFKATRVRLEKNQEETGANTGERAGPERPVCEAVGLEG
jgi:hypothetical protein